MFFSVSMDNLKVYSMSYNFKVFILKKFGVHFLLFDHTVNTMIKL